MSKLSSISRKVPQILRHGILACTGLFALLPFIWMVSLSLKPQEDIFAADFHLWPSQFSGVENYTAAFVSAPMLHFLANGIFVCAAIFLVQLIVCVPCAYALAKLRFCGKDTLFAAVLVGILIPPQALAIPHFIMLYLFGILNTYASLIVPWMISAFGIFLLRQFFRSIPDETLQAARLDGLGEFEIIWRIMLPMSTPAIAAFGIFSVVAHWNDLFWPLIAVRDQEISTPALGILLFRDDETGQSLGPLMAGSVIIVTPLLLAFLAAQRRFIDGMASTAAK